jgi:hypothetical protein
MTGGGRPPDLATSPFEAGWVSALHSTDDQLDTLLMQNREDRPMTVTFADMQEAAAMVAQADTALQDAEHALDAAQAAQTAAHQAWSQARMHLEDVVDAYVDALRPCKEGEDR